MRFAGKVALVTGATGGIGRAISERLASEGARVALHTATRPKEAEDLAHALAGSGHTVHPGDLREPGTAKRLVEGVLAAQGRLDILVNNAGVYEEHPILEASFEEWRRQWSETLALNLVAAADLCYWAARPMADQEGGSIVNVSSRGAFRGEPEAPAYGASKAGLNSLTQSLARALGAHNIRVSAVAPGFTESPMVTHMLAGETGRQIKQQSPMRRVATADEVAAVVAFLASDEAPFTTGGIVDVNGASYLRS